MNLYMNKIVEFYTNNYDEDTRLVRHRTEFITTTYILNKLIEVGSRILDLGAGTGIYSIYYANRGCSVIAIDIVPKHIEILNSKLRTFQNLDISAEVGDAEDLSRFREDSFDVVLCMGPLYNLQETDSCIKECLRVLRSKGIIAASYVKKNTPYEQDNEYKELFVSHTPEEIDQLFQDCEIEPIYNVPTDGVPFIELDEFIKDYTTEMDKLHSWLETHQSVFQKLDSIFIHGLYVGRKP